ncbi:interleukin-1 beta-like [Mantella aurantiaca]
MAEVPEINDLPMDCYSEEEFYAQCPSEIKVDMNHFEWSASISTESKYSLGITREIIKPRKPVPSFKKAIKLAIIIRRVSGRKGFEAECMFDDHDLLNHILVEEEISFREVDETNATPTKFQYRNAVTVHLIRDSRQKCMTLQEHQGSTHLMALFLQGSNLSKEAKINMGAYISSPFYAEKRPVTLSIVGRNLYLSCIVEEGDQDTPVLSLTEVTDIREKKNNDLLPFLFYKRSNGNSSNTFECVAFPNWYICTSQAENQFVQIKPQSDQTHIRDFQLFPTS